MPDEIMRDSPDHVALSWRDVYRAVYESEERIIAAVKDATRPLKDATDDHEARLRVLESLGCVKGQDALRVSTAVGAKLDALTLLVNANTDSRRGFLDTLSGGQRLIVTMGVIIGMAAVFLDIFSKYFGGP